MEKLLLPTFKSLSCPVVRMLLLKRLSPPYFAVRITQGHFFSLLLTPLVALTCP